MTRDLVCSAILLSVAAGYYFFANGIGTSALADEVGAAGLPLVYSYALAGVAFVMALQSIIRWILVGPKENKSSELRNIWFMFCRAGGVFGIGIGYLLIVNIVGYVIALLLVLMAMLFYFGEPIARRLVIVACAGAGFFWLLFDWLLGIPMPEIAVF